MLVLIFFAFVSGMVTILSPCILPVLPIVLSGSVGKGRARPFGTIAGFIISFAFFTLTLATLVDVLGLPVNFLRVTAVILLVLLGIIMAVPRIKVPVQILLSRIAGMIKPSGPGGKVRKSPGFIGGFLVGLSLGIVWTPCVGPIMASVISLALTSRIDGGAVVITAAYTLGTALPMAAVMLGGRKLLNGVPWLVKRTEGIQRIFGIVMIVVGISIAFGWERRLQTLILDAFPGYGSGLTALEENQTVRDALDARKNGDAAETEPVSPGKFRGAATPGYTAPGVRDYGEAPGFIAEGPWLNSDEFTAAASARDRPETGSGLTLDDFAGKVVLVDFWTYSCVNCIRTLPYLKAWDATYGGDGFVIVGVHTPEFEFEKNIRNVTAATRDLGVTWPVLLDNDYRQWNAYNNRYWPAHYLIDAQGHVRYYHFGEGGYAETENVIRELLAETDSRPRKAVLAPPRDYQSRTPEIYLGSARAAGFKGYPDIRSGTESLFTPSPVLKNAEWTLSGEWYISTEYITPLSSGVLELEFNAGDVYVVIEPGDGRAVIRVLVDGIQAPDTTDVTAGILSPDESRLYHLAAFEKGGVHRLRLDISGSPRIFAFTFG